MNNLYKLNPPFIVAFSLFILGATVMLFILEKGDVVLFFSDHRTASGDVFFSWITYLGDGLLFVLLGILLLFYKLRYSISIGLLGISVLIVSFLGKTIFSFDRPLPYFQKIGMENQLTFVAGVDVHTGATSFPSGHTMAAFAVFAFLAFILPSKKWIGALFLLLAATVGLSRIYLVQHFLQDIYLGSLLGVGLAWLWMAVQNRWKKSWMNEPLSLKPKKQKP